MPKTYLAIDVDDGLPNVAGTYQSMSKLLEEWHDSEDLDDMLFLAVDQNGEVTELDLDEEIKKGFQSLDETQCCAAGASSAPAQAGGFMGAKGGFLS